MDYELLARNFEEHNDTFMQSCLNQAKTLSKTDPKLIQNWPKTEQKLTQN